ncbi:MAG: hypothetical protein RLZZ214_2923 [Verrucomicrobiota bacterium]|jgi:uncharacterized membrane protein
MSRSAGGARSTGGEWAVDLGFLTLAFAGFALNLLLLTWRVSDVGAGIAGCGGAPCEEILASRWSVVFGVPVTGFGALVYFGIMASLAPACRRLSVPLLGAVVGGVFWFVFVQAVLIGKFCPWCLAAHGVGIAVTVMGLVRESRGGGFRRAWGELALWGFASFLMLGLVQVYGPVPTTYQLDVSLVAPSAAIQAKGAGRKITFDEGRKTFDAASIPRLGSLDAKRVLVEYFDFQCPSCRIMSGYLVALVEKHPADVCVLLLPVPLDHGCNPSLRLENKGHPGSCELTRIALAVWRTAPDSYPDIHRAFLSELPPSPAAALAFARGLVPGDRLDIALRDPWVEPLIRANIADWVSLSGKSDKLPKLLIRDKRILHGLPSGEADFIRVMERELGL